MLQSGSLSSKKILLLDRAPTTTGTKTWCFWDDGKIESYWKDAGIIHHEWKNLSVKKDQQELLLHIQPYSYKMIRSTDFNRYCLSKIREAPNVQLHFSAVTHIDEINGIVFCGEDSFEAPVIFSSVLLREPNLKPAHIYLLQHFKGWWIETEEDCFDDEHADLMNFNTPQKFGFTFLYVLPVTKRRALVEYTLFTEEILSDEDYNEGLRSFISEEMKITNYRITEEEKGVIPMTNISFQPQNGKVFFIGTAGGQTKPSTGYTFSFIQKQSADLVRSMETTGVPSIHKTARRFHYYDSILLKILSEPNAEAAAIFYSLFKKNKASQVFKFLDNETNFWEELRIMNSTDKMKFIPAAMQVISG
jgi:lycopene beta-cyclase